MLKWRNILLALASILLAIGLSTARPDNLFFPGYPAGAILLGLFLIALVLEKESAMRNGQGKALELARIPNDFQQHSFSVRQEVAHYPDPTTASLR
jgi:hypothetical protein